jgi:hypothetical protein
MKIYPLIIRSYIMKTYGAVEVQHHLNTRWTLPPTKEPLVPKPNKAG